MNERTQIKTNRPPETKSINFDAPANGVSNGSKPAVMARKKSNPPKNANKPNRTATCIQILRCAGRARHINPINNMGAPSIVGIKEVIDCEPVAREKRVP